MTFAFFEIDIGAHRPHNNRVAGIANEKVLIVWSRIPDETLNCSLDGELLKIVPAQRTMPKVKPQDNLAVLAFPLALFIMVFPYEADLLSVMFRNADDYFAGNIIEAACFTVVFTPFILSLRRRKRGPQARRGRGFLIATGIILALNLFLIGTTQFHHWFR